MNEEYLQKIKRYTVEELQRVLKSIDKDTYPERHEMVQNELANKLHEVALEPEHLSSLNGLASLGERVVASFIDAFIISIPLIIILICLYKTTDIVELQRNISFSFLLTTFTIGQCVYVLFNGKLLLRYGQTIGKQLMKIKIVDIENNLPKFHRSYGFRYFIPHLIYSIPFAGKLLSLIDLLFIYRKDRRCIHDHIAGTKVIKAI